MARKTAKGDTIGFKEQFAKIKDNWLIILVILILVVVVAGGADVFRSLTGSIGASSANFIAPTADLSVQHGYAEGSSAYIPPIPGGTSDFAPDVTNRVVTKTASLSNEVERGGFQAAEQRLKGIAATSKSLILSENSNRYGEGYGSYYGGNYQLKVPVDQYDSVVAQLKEIGDVKGFSESTQDITGQTISLAARLATEQDKLASYQKMMDETTNLQDKLSLTDRIYSQEQTVKWLEEQTTSNNERIDYSTLSVSITEKQSSFANIQFVRLGDLGRTLVSSLNALLYVVAFLIPWAALYGIYRLIRRLAGR